MKKRGGYREGSGRAKTGYYNGVYCGSTYELVWMIYQLDHSFEFVRFKGFLEFDGCKYYSDFLQNGKIIEIKGYESQELVDKKTKIANNCGYEVIVLRKEQLEKEFKWVKENYKFTKVYELYDNHKPKYNLICSCCKIQFETERKRIGDNVYCSRICAGRSRIGKGNPTGVNQYSKFAPIV